MITLAGAEPVTTGSASNWEMSTEALIAARPADHPPRRRRLRGDRRRRRRTRPGWDVLTAVKDGAITPVDDIVVTRPGPRLVDGLLALARAVHPDAVLPSLAPATP